MIILREVRLARVRLAFYYGSIMGVFVRVYIFSGICRIKSEILHFICYTVHIK